MTGDFKERLSQLLQNYAPTQTRADVVRFQLATQAVTDLFIELVEEDEPVIPAKELSEPLELAVERTKVGRNQLRAELINKLRVRDE